MNIRHCGKPYIHCSESPSETLQSLLVSVNYSDCGYLFTQTQTKAANCC